MGPEASTHYKNYNITLSHYYTTSHTLITISLIDYITNMETNGSSNVYRIEPLKGADNYAVWKIKMMDILTNQGLWEYVDPGMAPSDTNQKPAWDKKDRTALSTIRLRVADKLLVYVASSKSLKEAWDSLKGLLEAQGPLGIVLA